MKDLVHELPGIARIRARFVEMLEDRQKEIAASALAAWDATSAAYINENLGNARAILHQIAGSAGSLGLVELGDTARSCEEDIIDHLEGPNAGSDTCPDGLIASMDAFIAKCRTLLDEQD